MRRNLCQLLAVLVLTTGGAVWAKNVKYAGMHPRTGKPNGGLCYVEAVHVHPLAPSNASLYRTQNGIHVFVGDPLPFGYEGPKHRFYGHHPITVDLIVPDFSDETVYCYIDGPHWHSHEPPHSHAFVEKEEVHYFSGEYPETYHREKDRFVTVNKLYRPIAYERPVVVEIAPQYRGPVLDVKVLLPMPAVGLQIGIGSPAPRPATVIVHEHHPHKGKHKKFKNKKFKERH